MIAKFKVKIPGTYGTDAALFKQFQIAQPSMNHTNYFPGILEAKVHRDFRNNEKVLQIIKLLKDTLTQYHFRNDYKKFLHLALIFLGETPQRQITFVYLGAIHLIRRMRKVIYSLKMYFFRKEFQIEANIENAFQQIKCIFIVKVYAKGWFTAHFAISAPVLDLQLLHDLNNYKQN